MNWTSLWHRFSRARNSGSADITGELEHAKSLHQQGQLQQAYDIYQSLLARYPNSAETLNSAAIMDSQTGNPDSALAKVNKALAILPDQVEFYNTKGYVLQSMKRFDEALESYKTGLEHGPQNIAVRLNMGNTYRLLKKYELALEQYQQIIQLRPAHAGAYCNMGNVYDEIAEYENAIKYYKKALELDPETNMFYTLLAGTLRKVGQLKEAIDYCQQALERRPDNAEVYNDLGNLYLQLDQHEKALSCYQKAYELNPDYSMALKNMGVAYQELGQQEQASACYKKLEDTDDGYAEAQHYLTMLDNTAIDAENLATLLRVFDDQQDRMHLHYALGKAYMGQKDYSQAFEHFRHANALKRKTIDYDAAVNSAYIDQLIDYFNEGLFQATAVAGNPSRLPVFILGMPRSGTTLVEQIISNHSEVYGAGELTAFAAIEQNLQNLIGKPFPVSLDDVDGKRMEQEATEYLQQLSKPGRQSTRVTDKLPGNFLRVGLIKLLFPNAFIIHCQRNPVDTCVSIYTNYFADGYKYAYELKELANYYVDYTRIMAHWRSLFSDSMLEVHYEQLVQNQESVSRQMLDYLGLGWETACFDFHQNQRVVKSASNVQVRQPIYRHSVARWKHFREGVQPMLDIFNKHGLTFEDGP